MALECQLASNGLAVTSKDPRVKSLEAGASNWRLLFQVDSDDELGLMWGDAGMLYYWVEEHRACRGDFSNVWLILQCT